MIKIGNILLNDFPLLLAPMEDVSDPPFRAICKDGGADMMYTEFISSEGLIRDAAKSKKKLDIFSYERPIGIQLFGGQADSLKEATIIATAAQPDLIDINYGCPVKSVVSHGGGAKLLQDVDKMVAITRKVVQATPLPVTVKTRLGWDDRSINIETVAERLQDVGIAALTIHGRTRAQMYKGEANWAWIDKVKRNPRIRIPIFGNGDIDSPEKAKEYRERYQVDGMMIGRATIGAPWIFNQIKAYLNDGIHIAPPSMAERVEIAKKHLAFSVKWKGPRVGVLEMRRHYTKYFRGFSDIQPFRKRLVEAPTEETVYQVLDDLLCAHLPTSIA